MEFKENLIIVADCDEVLTNISPLWAELIHRNGDFFGKYFDLMPDFDYTKPECLLAVLRRKEFYINKCFRKEDLPELSKEEEDELFRRFYELYDNEKFYNYVEPTRMGKALAELAQTNYLNKIYVVSRTTDKTLESKKKFLDNLFKHSKGKYEFVPVAKDEKKSDAINKLGRVDVVIDDELSNVKDIILNCSPEIKMDIYIPKLGYNKPSKELDEMCIDRNKNIIYYNAI